jgi:hypothetical protein
MNVSRLLPVLDRTPAGLGPDVAALADRFPRYPTVPDVAR